MYVLTRIVSAESQNDIPLRIQDQRVATHGKPREVGIRDVRVLERAGLLLGSVYRLEVVPVEMEGVAPRVEVVDDDLHDFPPVEDERVRVRPVHCWVRCLLAC